LLAAAAPLIATVAPAHASHQTANLELYVSILITTP
jgi:hypothetical protein